jgi:predicted peptidase
MMIKNLKKLWMVGFFSLASVAMTTAYADGVDGSTVAFIPQTVEIDGYSIPYAIFVPQVEDTKNLPITLYLHGAGERGSDGVKQTTAGIGPALKAHPERFPTIVVLPQVPFGLFWDNPVDPKNPNSPNTAQLALKALDDTMKAYESDPNRVYLTGNSMGGAGTWKMGSEYPNLFAAIMPICGYGKPEMAEPLKDMPIYAFHGALDFNVNPDESRKMVAAVRATGNTRVHYTEYPTDFHDSWDDAYSDTTQLEEFFSEKLPH